MTTTMQMPNLPNSNIKKFHFMRKREIEEQLTHSEIVHQVLALWKVVSAAPTEANCKLHTQPKRKSEIHETLKKVIGTRSPLKSLKLVLTEIEAPETHNMVTDTKKMCNWIWKRYENWKIAYNQRSRPRKPPFSSWSSTARQGD